MWSTIVAWMRGAAILWVGLIGVGAILQQADVVPALPKLEPFAWIFSLVIIAVDNAGTLLVRRVRRSKADRDQQIEKALMGLLISVARTKNVRFEELGSSIYVPGAWDAIMQRGNAARNLTRIVRFRPAGYPAQSGIKWTPATGTVGDCWKSQKGSYKDWHAIAVRYGGSDITDGNFETIPVDTRQGFNRKQFAAIVDKYSEILAEPIWHSKREGKLLGVLTIDRAYQSGDDTFAPQLHKAQSRMVATATTSVVSRILEARTTEV